MSQSNTNIIERLKNKDETALSTLYDQYSAALYGVIIRMCRDEQQAQNILQDTFLTIWNKSHQYDPEKGKFYTWSYRIARNKTLNFLRKENKLIQTDDFSVYTIENESESPTIDSLQMKGYLEELDDHHKRALELIYFNGLTHQEAHEEMGVPLGTFKSYVRQALKKLKANYGKAVIWALTLIDILK